MHIVGDQNNFQSEVLDFKGKCLIDFWAPWCGPCQMLGPLIDELGDELKGQVKVLKINVDENQEIASKYNISSIPAVLIVENGVAKNTLVGFRQKQEYLDALK